MKKINIVLLLMFVIVGCENDPKENAPEPTTLLNTKWKLVGFFDIEKNELIEPMAKDCADCYTLEFMDDSIHTILGSEKGCYVAVASMINVSPFIYYTIDYQNSSFNVEIVMRTMNVDYLDGERYGSGLYADKFELTNNELKLYYTDDWDKEIQWPYPNGGGPKKPFYLLFKRSDL